jgi:hypothetical protein
MDIMSYSTWQIMVLGLAILAVFLIALALVSIAVREEFVTLRAQSTRGDWNGDQARRSVGRVLVT